MVGLQSGECSLNRTLLVSASLEPCGEGPW